MDSILDILTDRKFWASYMSSQWAGCVVSPEWPHAYEFGYNLFDVDREECLSSWKKLTGWYEDVFKDADGYVDNPCRIEMSLANNLALQIEIHPGCKFYRLRRNGSEQTLGEIGGHWRLPALQWSEAMAMSNVCSFDSNIRHDMAASFALLLLAPVVWLTENENVSEVASALENAWITIEMVDGDTASRFGQECAKAMNVGAKYRWWKDPTLGWVTKPKSD